MIFQRGSHIASVLSERWNNKSAENIIWNLLAGIVCQMWKSYLILLLWDMKEKRDDIRYEDSLYLVIATMIDKTQLADSIWSTGRKSFWTKLKKLYWWWSGVCNSNSIFNIEDNLITFKRCCVMIANEVRRRNNRVCFRRLSQKKISPKWATHSDAELIESTVYRKLNSPLLWQNVRSCDGLCTVGALNNLDMNVSYRMLLGVRSTVYSEHWTLKHQNTESVLVSRSRVLCRSVSLPRYQSIRLCVKGGELCVFRRFCG